MIATWMLYGTAVALLVGLGALALERGARVLGRAGRWGWLGALAITLALPAVAWVRPNVLPPVISIPTQNDGSLEATPPVRIVAPTITYRARHSLTWSDLNRPLAYGWGLLSLGLLAWFGVGAWRLRRMRRSWRADGDILVSENVGPAVVGFLRCRIVVPEWSLELGVQQRELLLAHEAEHLAAHDARLLMLAAALVALVPWNLGLWWQFRRLRLAIELDCDQRVLRRRPDRAIYGRLLLDVGARAARSLVPVAAFHEPASSLELRIRALTTVRPPYATLWGVGSALAAVVAIIAACEAPRPTGPAQSGPFSIQFKQEDGRISSSFIADSVRYYFPNVGASGAVYLWFVVSPESHVLRYGTTPRNPADHVIRSERVDSVIPDFESRATQSVTIVGENAIGAGSPPVYWAQLRDPSKPATWLSPGVDSLALLPWVRDGLQKYWSPLLAEKSGPPTDIWFVADRHRHILTTLATDPAADGRRGLGTDLIAEHFPVLTADRIVGFTITTAHSWARSNVNVVWVTLRDGPATEAWRREAPMMDTIRAVPVGPWLWRSEAADTSHVAPPSRAVMEERGRALVAADYPQFVHTPVPSGVTIWVLEGPGGRRISQHLSKAYRTIGGSEVAAEMPGYEQFRPGEWMSRLPLEANRGDVTIVWMHSNRSR